MGGPVIVEEAFFFNGIEPTNVLPWLPATLAVRRAIVVAAAATAVVFAGTGETGGCGLAGVGAERGVGGGVGWRPIWAEHRTGVERVGGLLAVVGVT